MKVEQGARTTITLPVIITLESELEIIALLNALDGAANDIGCVVDEYMTSTRCPGAVFLDALFRKLKVIVASKTLRKGKKG